MTFKSSKKLVAYLGIKYTITNLMLVAFFYWLYSTTNNNISAFWR